MIHYTAAPVVGGVERVMAQHARSLALGGSRVTIVAGRGGAADGIDLRRLPLVDSLHPEVVAAGSELADGRVPPAFDVLRGRLLEDLTPLVLDADVVILHNVASMHLNLPLTTALADLSGRRAGGGFVLWHHDLAWTMPRHRHALHDGHPWDLLRTPWPGAVQVTISEGRRHDLAALLHIPETTIRVVPDGVDVAGSLGLREGTRSLLATLPILDADPLLLLPARILPRKNIELALRTVAALVAMGRPAGLLVTGPVDPHHPSIRDGLETLLALRDGLGLADRAWFPGLGTDQGLADEVMADLFALADALFLPSLDEGFGIPVLEALLHRLPIVCSDLQVLRELAGPAATWIDPHGDPAAVARQVMETIDGDPVRRLQRSVRREWSWEAIGRRHLSPLITQVLATRG